MEKGLPQWFLAILHCCEADDLRVAFVAVRTVHDMACGADEMPQGLHVDDTLQQPMSHTVLSMLNETLHGEAVAYQVWEILPAAQPLAKMRAMGNAAWEAPHEEGAVASDASSNAALELWMKTYELAPAVCLKVLRESLLGSYKPADRVDHFKRFSYLWSAVSAVPESFAALRSQLSSGLFPVLDALADQSVSVRLTAKSCLQKAFDSAGQVLGPLFEILLDSSTARDENFTYLKPFDAGKALYVWEKLASVVNCPALQFLLRAGELPLEPGLLSQWNQLEAVRVGQLDEPLPADPLSYLDLCACTALRYAQGNVKCTAGCGMRRDGTCDGMCGEHAANADVRATAVEYMSSMFESAGSTAGRLCALSKKLLLPCLNLLIKCVGDNDEIMQLQLLGLLRLLLVADSEGASGQGGRARVWAAAAATQKGSALLETLVAGISHRHHADSQLGSAWINFIPECLPLLGDAELPTLARSLLLLFSDLIPEVAETCHVADTDTSGEVKRTASFGDVATLFEAETASVKQSSTPQNEEALYSSFRHSPQLLLKLRGLVAVVRYCLEQGGPETGETAIVVPADNSGMLAGLMTSMTSVFLDDAPGESLPSQVAPDVPMLLYQEMNAIVIAAIAAWGPPTSSGRPLDPVGPVPHLLSSGRPGLDDLRAVIQEQLLRIMSRMMKSRTRDFVSGLIDWWQQEPSGSRKKSLMELLHNINGIAADAFLTAGCDILAAMYLKARGSAVPAAPLLAVLEQPVAAIEPTWAALMFTYISTCPIHRADSFSRAWPSVLQLCNDALHSGLSSHHSPVPVALYLLRMLEAFVRRCPPLTEKQDRKDLQDLVQRLVGQCITIMQQTFDIGAAARSAPAELQTAMRRALQATGELRLEYSLLAATIVRTNGEEGDDGFDINLISLGRCLSLISLRLLTELLQPLFCNVWSDDKERLVSTLSGFVPAIMSQLRNRDPACASHAEACTRLIGSFASNSSTLAMWRRDVLDVFNETDFFCCDRPTLSNWRVILQALLEGEPGLFDLILSKGVQSQTLLSRLNSQESNHRVRTLKRLSFLLLSGDTDQYLSAMPVILEQLVEAIKVADEEGESLAACPTSQYLSPPNLLTGARCERRGHTAEQHGRGCRDLGASLPVHAGAGGSDQPGQADTLLADRGGRDGPGARSGRRFLSAGCARGVQASGPARPTAGDRHLPSCPTELTNCTSLTARPGAVCARGSSLPHSTPTSGCSSSAPNTSWPSLLVRRRRRRAQRRQPKHRCALSLLLSFLLSLSPSLSFSLHLSLSISLSISAPADLPHWCASVCLF